MGLSYSEVAEILKIIDGSSCNEVVLEQNGVKLVIRRGAQTQTNPSVSTAAPAASKSTALEKPPASQVPTASKLQGSTICAPMVGTFYASPAPDEPPFVQVGTRVTKGMPLCIIEVMKLFTTVEATQDGILEAILVEDGQLVEFDQPLFLFA